MQKPKHFIHQQTYFGKPITANGITVTPQSQAITVKWPWGGWVFNRPIAVLTQADGQAKRIAVVDTTRLWQLFFIALSLLFLLIAIIHSKKGCKYE